ncbi:MAG TPA: uroporphyrinogen decarboxylase family protein [Armatimonadota bacterium]|nr:uroporphyrinogen decarboxylase family protein [Armatimonadota bacterium]
MMTNKDRMRRALEGKPVDRCPVTSLYNFLYQQDHFSELTGLPAWRLQQWLADEPEAHAALFARMQANAPFETLQPHGAPPRAWRERQEFVERDGHAYRHDRHTDAWVQLDLPTESGHAADYHANETRYVFTRADVDARVTLTRAADQLAEGANDYLDAIVRRFGREEFILSGGVIGTLYSCHWHVGLTNLFPLLLDEPELMAYVSEKLLAQNLETIRRLAAAGGDAIYIDDATATSDMISPALYARFCQPYITAMVEEIHRLGHHAILIYFGGVMDRLEQIAMTGGDGLLYEASMKGFVNDTAEIARRIGDRMTLFSNIDPVTVLQDATEAEVEAEIRRQVEAGRAARGFIISTASPITPATPLARVRRFLELSTQLGARV